MLYLLLTVQMRSFAHCVCERERDRVTVDSAVLIAACVCVRARETDLHHSGVYRLSEIVLIAACLQTHTSIITVSVTRLFPFRASTDAKTKDIINCLYFHFES